MTRAAFYRGDAHATQPDPAHRGVAYGDGLFETMRVHRGMVPWWDRHWARLAEGAHRLRIPLPDAAFVAAEAEAMLDGRDDGILKLILSRGGTRRGYAPSAGEPAWQLVLDDGPLPGNDAGLLLRWCALRLSTQPLLAGLKHCNRLEQVLARAEWNDGAADEGLLCDQDGHLVCATAANVFVLRDAHWSTPLLDRCGVAGICRGWAMGALGAREARIGRDDVASADAVFLCNAVRGILPVARLERRAWAPHPEIARTLQLLAAAHPAFRPS